MNGESGRFTELVFAKIRRLPELESISNFPAKDSVLLFHPHLRKSLAAFPVATFRRLSFLSYICWLKEFNQ
jgi:hypothetical protein